MKREFPFDPLDEAREPALVGRAERVPLTAIDALQEAGTQEPKRSLEERVALQEIVLDSLSVLNEEEVWLLNALLFERLSLREIQRAIGIPKTTVARYRDKILSKLRVALADNPAIHEYLLD